MVALVRQEQQGGGNKLIPTQESIKQNLIVSCFLMFAAHQPAPVFSDTAPVYQHGWDQDTVLLHNPGEWKNCHPLSHEMLLGDGAAVGLA